MKIDAALMAGEPEEELEGTTAVEPEEEDGLDESDSHSRLKTFLLLAAMIGGFGLFVWNMTGLVNSMRLDNQGMANIVYEMDLDDFRDGNDNLRPAADENMLPEEGGNSVDAARDGPVEKPPDPGGTEQPGSGAQYMDESEEVAALRQQLADTENEMALLRQKQGVTEDMLDSSLAREAELQGQIDTLKDQLDALKRTGR